MIAEEINLKDKLREVFGYTQFRGLQEEIIDNLMAGNDTFVLMPTGAGKSLCYQLPAIIRDGTAIIISPLIALMKNQVDQLAALSINAQFLNSTLSKAEITKVKKGVLAGQIKLLYVAPESLTKESNLEFLKSAKLSFIAIDEAHCISEWGHDFRPEYRRIRMMIDLIGNMPIIALTATATPKVQIDIQKNLRMENAKVFKSSFNRTNLYYEVRAKTAIKKQLIKYLKSHKGESGIIYCLSRKKVEEVYELLKVNDVKVAPYHAGLESQVRMQNQDGFLNEEIDVIVATIAFGMGIDKPDVRFVIHYDAPKSLEGYYQETGRAGRDGIESDCIMFYSPHDILKLEKFNKDKTVSERDNARHLVQEMMAYSASGVCRRRLLLSYFGEVIHHDCGKCNNCVYPTNKFSVKEQIIWCLETAVNTGERFALGHIVDVIRGEKTSYVMSYGHDGLATFGKGKDNQTSYWESVVRHCVVFDFLYKDIDNYGVLHLSEKGKSFLADPYSVELSEEHDYSKVSDDEDDDKELGNFNSTRSHDLVLFEMLKGLRKKVAKQKGFPPFAIFQDPSLEEMATFYPTTEDDLAQINGVGMGKVQRYGKPFLEMIQKYVQENDIETAQDVVVRSAINKSKTKIWIIQQIDRKVDLEEISEAKNMSMFEVLDEIEHICYSGTRLNLDYYIDRIMDEERQDEVYDYFMNADTDNLPVALEYFDEDYSEEELRLMRIKFMSEIAN